MWGRVLARLGQQGFPEAWKWEEASARLKSRGKRIQKTQRNNIEFFLILNFQLTMENVKVCEIEWRGAVCRRGSRLWQARTREALMARIPNHKSIFTQRKELCFPPCLQLLGVWLAEQGLVKAGSWGQVWDHLVAGSLIILLQRVKILRALPNPKGTQPH